MVKVDLPTDQKKCIYLFFRCLFTYFERERERERERIPSSLHAVSTESNAGLEPMNHEIMT